MAFFEDLRYGARNLAKNPAFTLVAVSALALGIGVNAVVFAITNGVLFKGLPFVSDRILYLSTRNLTRGQRRVGVSYPDYRDWRAQARSFRTMGAYRFQIVNISDQGNTPARFNLGQMTANSFTIIGQRPVIGRDFMPEDEKAGAAPVAILGNGLWEGRYGRNPGLLGQIIRVNGVPATVIGVMQPGFK